MTLDEGLSSIVAPVRPIRRGSQESIDNILAVLDHVDTSVVSSI